MNGIVKPTEFSEYYQYLLTRRIGMVNSDSWTNIEAIVKQMVNRLQSAIDKGEAIGEDPLLDHVMEAILLYEPMGELSPAQWKEKRIKEQFSYLKGLYQQIRVEKIEVINEEVEIKNIDEYFKMKKFIRLSSFSDFINERPIVVEYYDSYQDFLFEIRKLLGRKTHPKYVVNQICVMCEELIKEVPALLEDKEFDQADCAELLWICQQFLENYSAKCSDPESVAQEVQKLIKRAKVNEYLSSNIDQ